MRKTLDRLLTAVAPGVAILAVLLCWWRLNWIIAQAAPEELPPVQAALPTLPPSPAPTQPEPAPPLYVYHPAVPLPAELQGAWHEACRDAAVPECLILGPLEVESGFDPAADNGLCYGLCQLNRDWFPGGLSPADNLRAGIAYLGELLARYGDPAAALTAYNAGHDTGSRTYADAVLAAAERWEGALG